MSYPEKQDRSQNSPPLGDLSPEQTLDETQEMEISRKEGAAGCMPVSMLCRPGTHSSDTTLHILKT